VAITKKEFRLDGGATWLNLLATRGRTFGARPVERLADTADLDRWLAASGLAPRSPATPADVDAAHALRAALRDLAMSAVEGRDAPADAAALVGRAAGAVGRVGLDGAWGVTGLADVGEALALVAAGALVTLAGPDRAHLTECAEHDCRWVFLDPTGRRRWCPEPACASRGRVRAHRERAARTASA